MKLEHKAILVSPVSGDYEHFEQQCSHLAFALREDAKRQEDRSADVAIGLGVARIERNGQMLC